MTIYHKLNDARLTFHQTEIKKTGWNAFSKYAYFELSDFLVPALKIFHDVGLCAVVSFGDGLATMTIREVEGDGVIVITSPLAEAPLKGTHPIQQMGAVETYSRRHLWVAALEIVEHDAIDSNPGVTSDDLVAQFEERIQKMTTSEEASTLREEMKKFCAEQNKQSITNRLSKAFKQRVADLQAQQTEDK